MASKNAKDAKSTGEGGQEQSELEILVEEMSELSEESDTKFQEVTEGEKKRAEVEKQQAEDIRLKAMETMGETRRRIKKMQMNKARRRKREEQEVIH